MALVVVELGIYSIHNFFQGHKVDLFKLGFEPETSSSQSLVSGDTAEGHLRVWMPGQASFYTHHHPVPCFIALAIMSFHIPRSLVAFRISTALPAPSQLTRPSVIFSRCFPLLRFPSIIPVVMRFSNFSLLIT